MEDFQSVISGSKPVLVDFYATWCGPCKIQGRILEDVAASVGDRCRIVKVDVDAEGELASRFRVRSVPTLVVFKDGEPVWRVSGLQPADVLTRKISEYA